MRRLLLTLVVLGMCSCVLGGTARAGQAQKTGKKDAEQAQKDEDERPYTDVEATAVYGYSTGFGTCGEQMFLRHAGGAARVRHAMRPPHARRGMGATVAASVMVEADQFTVQAADPDMFEYDNDSAPTRRYHFAVTSADLRVGYHFRYVGLEGGVSTWLPHGAPNEYAYRQFFPTGELTLGPRQLAFVVAGVGSPELAWIRAWGMYLGAGVRLPAVKWLPGQVELSMSYGIYMTPTMEQERFFALLYVPIHRSWDLRGSFSLGPVDEYTPYQGGFGFRAKF